MRYLPCTRYALEAAVQPNVADFSRGRRVYAETRLTGRSRTPLRCVTSHPPRTCMELGPARGYAILRLILECALCHRFFQRGVDLMSQIYTKTSDGLRANLRAGHPDLENIIIEFVYVFASPHARKTKPHCGCSRKLIILLV